jgi:hypothetical protein
MRLLLLFMFRFNVKAVLSLSLKELLLPMVELNTPADTHGSRDTTGSMHIYVGGGRQAYPQTTSWLHVWTALHLANCAPSLTLRQAGPVCNVML